MLPCLLAARRPRRQRARAVNRGMRGTHVASDAIAPQMVGPAVPKGTRASHVSTARIRGARTSGSARGHAVSSVFARARRVWGAPTTIPSRGTAFPPIAFLRTTLACQRRTVVPDHQPSFAANRRFLILLACSRRDARVEPDLTRRRVVVRGVRAGAGAPVPGMARANSGEIVLLVERGGTQRVVEYAAADFISGSMASCL